MGYVHHANDEDDRFICGEVLDNDQKWYVDGYPSPSNAILPTIDEQRDEEALMTPAANTGGPTKSLIASVGSTISETLFWRHSPQRGEGSGSNAGWSTRNGTRREGLGIAPKRASTTLL